mgnify:CR=1 FL=1
MAKNLLLKLDGVCAGYGDIEVLHEVSLEVAEGEIVALLGANAAGKTTALRVISGLIPVWRGEIYFEERPISRVPPDERVELGIVQVPEGRRLFPFMTVRENLLLGAYNRRARRSVKANLKRVLELFPVLAEREHQLAGSLSGGEQQMCAIGRALMASPRILLLDEPSLGLAPLVVRQIYGVLPAVRAGGVTAVIVEQNVKEVLGLADRAYVLENGRVVLSGPSGQLREDERLKRAYLGI